MGTIKVKINRIGGKAGDCVSYHKDERVYQGQVIEISDAPRMRVVKDAKGEPVLDINGDEQLEAVPGSIAAFSDNKRKKWPGYMQFADPADEKKYRAGGFNPAGSAAVAAKPEGKPAEASKPAAAAAKPAGKSSGDKDVI